MIISKEQKFVFIHNPKVAGTSIRSYLSEFDSFDGFFWHRGMIEGIEHTIDKAHIPLNDLLKTEYAQYLNSSDFFIFGFVRNPYERVYSAYLEKKRQWREGSKDFNSFIKELNEINIRYDFNLVHFCPQHYFFYNGRKCFADFIGKIENIERDFNTITSFLSLEYAPIIKINESMPDRDNKRDYLSFYNKESIQIVNRLYEKDFLFFDYEMLGDIQLSEVNIVFKEGFAKPYEKKPISELLFNHNQLKNALLLKSKELDLKSKELEIICSSKAWRLIQFYRKLLKCLRKN